MHWADLSLALHLVDPRIRETEGTQALSQVLNLRIGTHQEKIAAEGTAWAMVLALLPHAHPLPDIEVC